MNKTINLLCFLIMLTSVVFADPINNWNWRNPLPQGDHLNGATYGNNTFVVVGEAGTILTSVDGVTWAIISSGISNSLYGITFGNNMFVATGSSGMILTSVDGVTWTTGTSGTSNDLSGVTYVNNTFVIVGQSGTILTSGDGVTWITRASGTSDLLYEVTYGDSTFVAVGDGGTILTSGDGVIWADRLSGTSNYLKGVTFDNNTFITVGGLGTILTSPDGITWTTRASGTSNDLIEVTYDNSTFVAVGDLGTILTSPDGITWTTRISGTPYVLDGLANGNNMFVAVGTAGTLLTSGDGITWITRTSGTFNILNGAIYGNNIFVAAGVGKILTSPDGVTWTTRASGTPNLLHKITYGSSTFVAVGNAGEILTSGDGITWTTRTSGTSYSLNGVAHGNNIFVTVGDSGTVLTSPDGIVWTARTSGTSNLLYGVTHGNSTFVAVGDTGTVLTSGDGITWITMALETPYSLNGVAYGSNTFAAVSWNDSAVLTSSSGVVWTNRYLEPTNFITYTNNIFVAVGNSILTSGDGVTWTSRLSVSGSLYGVTYGSNTFVAVGNWGKILQSDPLPNTPDISVSLSEINFDTVNTGSSSVHTLTVSSTGFDILNISTLSITGTDVSEFNILNDSCSGKSLSYSDSVTVDIVFSPTSIGEKTANLIIPSNDPYNSTLIVSLSGYRFSQPPQVSLNASPDFGYALLQVDFTANAYDTDSVIEEFKWDFEGDGNFDTTTLTNTISYTYPVGSYIAKVKVTSDDGGTAEDTETIVALNHTLTASSGDGGSISPSGDVSVNDGASQTFNISASQGYHVADVLVDSTSIGNETTYTFNNIISGHEIFASFAVNTYTINASAGNGGAISPFGSTVLNYGSSQTFNIIPDTDYHIADVLVDSVSVGIVSAYTFNNVTADHTISASFAINTYSINATAGSGGTITPLGNVTVDEGASKTFNITPYSGYYIDHILVDNQSLGAKTTYTFSNVNSNHTITAIFGRKTYKITVSSVGGGTIKPFGEIELYEDESQIFNIRVNTGYKIEDVIIDGVSINPVGVWLDYKFENVKADHSIVVVFSPITKGNIDSTSPGSDNLIDGHDLYKLSRAFGSVPYDSNWNSMADLDNNGIVDGNDLTILASNFGKQN